MEDFKNGTYNLLVITKQFEDMDFPRSQTSDKPYCHIWIKCVASVPCRCSSFLKECLVLTSWRAICLSHSRLELVASKGRLCIWSTKTTPTIDAWSLVGKILTIVCRNGWSPPYTQP